MGGTSFIAINV